MLCGLFFKKEKLGFGFDSFSKLEGSSGAGLNPSLHILKSCSSGWALFFKFNNLWAWFKTCSDSM